MLVWLLFKILGIILILFGGFFIILGPGTLEHHQIPEFGVGTIIVGVVMLLIGIYLLLS